MPITFDSNKKIFHLQTPNTSYIFMLKGDYVLAHLYYGKRIDDISGIENTININICSGFSALNYEYYENGENISTDVLPQEYAFYGSCDLRKPSFHAQYADGSRITKMKYVSHKIFDSKPKLEGLPSTYTEADSEAQTLEIEMKDELTGLVLVYRYSVFSQFDAITRSVTAKNEGEQSLNIKSILSCNVDFSDNDFDFIHLHGAWAIERHIQRVPVMNSGINIQSRRGSSSHNQSPFFALARKNTNEEQGEVYGFSFVYSGNFEAGVEVDSKNFTRAYMGINSFDFNWLLEPNQTFTAPEVVMVYSSEGIGTMSRTYHKLYRTRLARGKYRDIERPVLINNWEATYFNFNEDKIVEIAKTAKQAGIELMVLDDGWFGKRDNDTTSLGDWFVDKNKLPNGIDGLAKRVTELGMQFGLWFEPEMVSPISELYEAHPDWCLHVNGRGRSQGRQQLILDLSRDDVCDYIISFMSDALENAPISYIKWDMNRNMTEIGSALLPPERQAETAHRYMLGLYRILETLTQKFPDVLFEGCSGGGGRFDAGMMYYFSQYWTSDDSDAIERLYIQEGTSLVMPSMFMGAHVSAVPNHQVGRITPLQTRGIVAMCGQFGYELDITKMPDEELSEIAEQVKYYKSVREVIHKGDMYRLVSPFGNNHTAWEFISEDGNTVILVSVIIKAVPAKDPYTVKLSGLSGNSIYKLRDTDNEFSGNVLMNCGIITNHKEDFSSQVMIFDKISK